MRVIVVLSLIVVIGAASGVARAYWEERRRRHLDERPAHLLPQLDATPPSPPHRHRNDALSHARGQLGETPLRRRRDRLPHFEP